MQSDDLTLKVLVEIRDQIGQTNARIDETNARLETGLDELGRRITESEIRTATAIHRCKREVDELMQLVD